MKKPENLSSQEIKQLVEKKSKPIPLIGICRKGYRMQIPCNYNIQGQCGEDSKPCKLEKMVFKNAT